MAITTRDYDTLYRVLKRIMDSDREDAIEVLGMPLYESAAEFVAWNDRAKECAKEDAKASIDKNAKEHGHMTVTKLKMESDSCTK